MAKKVKQTLAVIVGGNITARRKAQGLNQAQLAERLEIGADSLSRIERGLTAPRFSTLEKIAEVLGCQVAELFLTGRYRHLEDLPEFHKNISPDMLKNEIVFMAERIIQIARSEL